MMMIPEAFGPGYHISLDKQAFYEYHGAILEPVGRPCRDALYRRPVGGRHARPQRPAAQPLRGHDRGPGGAGQRGGRDRVPAGADRAQGPLAAGPHVPRRYGGRPHRGRQRDQGQDRPPEALSPLAGEPHRAARAVPAGTAGRGRSRQADAAPAGLRLHAGRPADDRRPYGGQRPGAGRVDGHRHAAGRAFRPAQAALRLLQAVVRPGHEPAHRSPAGRAGDVAPDLHRQAAEPA